MRGNSRSWSNCLILIDYDDVDNAPIFAQSLSIIIKVSGGDWVPSPEPEFCFSFLQSYVGYTRFGRQPKRCMLYFFLMERSLIALSINKVAKLCVNAFNGTNSLTEYLGS